MCDKTVVIPFALNLAGLIPPVAVRLRCDFKLLLSLITSHALLHRDNRKCDAEGHLIATVADYAAVRRLVSDYLEAAVKATVSPTIRDTVQAVEGLLSDRPSASPWVSQAAVATRLDLDKSATSRRIREALARGYLVNNEARKFQPMQLVMGDPLPEDQTLLPSPEALRILTHVPDDFCFVDQHGCQHDRCLRVRDGNRTCHEGHPLDDDGHCDICDDLMSALEKASSSSSF